MQIPKDDKQHFLGVALMAAAKARTFILQGVEKGFDSEMKADKTIVTDIDRGAEELLRAELQKAFPDHGVVGEEFGAVNEDSPFKWYIDPIDGTFNFARGVPMYGSLLALEYEGESILGVLDHPAMDMLYYATDGGGAFLNGKRLPYLPEVTEEEIKNNIIAICRRECFEKADALKAYDWIFKNHNHIRISPSSFGGCLTAKGAYLAKADFDVSKYDYAPLKVLLNEVGGKIHIYKQRKLRDGQVKDDIILGNPAVVDYLLEIFNRFK